MEPIDAAKKIYEAIGQGYGYNGSKEECIKIIEQITKQEMKKFADKCIREGWQHLYEDRYYNETMDISKTLDEILEAYFNQPTNNKNQTP